ncbi:MAG: sialidase family protein [Isosphaeraceae bacterium]
MMFSPAFLALSPVLAVVILAPGPARAQQAPATRPAAVIFEGRYPGWPWVARGGDGTLFCVFREGTVHDFSPSGKVMLSRSTDQGRTWTRAETIVDAPEVDDRNVAIVELPDRSLLVTYNTYTAARESTAKSVRSIDGGKTWSAPTAIGIPNTRTRAAAVVLHDGTVVLPLYLAPGSGAVAARSSDHGRTWQSVRVPDAQGFVGDEWDLLEVEPGRLIGILRNNQPGSDGCFWKTESSDGGRTWSVPRPTNVRSKRSPSPPQIVRHGQTLLLIYADRRMVSVSAVRAMGPDFLHWDLEHRLPCYLYNPDESPILDASYPVSARLDDRRRIIVDYEIRSDSRRIAAYVVTLPTDWK